MARRYDFTLGVGGDFTTINAMKQWIVDNDPWIQGDVVNIDQISNVEANASQTTDVVGTAGAEGGHINIFCSANRTRPLREWYTYNYRGRDIQWRGFPGSANYRLWYDHMFITSTSTGGSTLVPVAGNIGWITNCMLRGYITGTGTLKHSGIEFGKIEGDYVRILNCKIWQCIEGINIGTGAGVPGTFPDRKFVENVTIDECGDGIDQIDGPSNLANWKNIVICRCTNTAWRMTSSGYQTITNCAVDDGSLPYGTNLFQGIIPADEFQSLDDTNLDAYLALPRGGTKYLDIDRVPPRGRTPLHVDFEPSVRFAYGDMGPVLPTNGIEGLTTADILGNDRPGEDDRISIGCHEPVFDWRLDQVV